MLWQNNYNSRTNPETLAKGNSYFSSLRSTSCSIMLQISFTITLQLSLSYSRDHRTCKGSEGGAPPLTTHCVRTPACPPPSPLPAPRAISAIECITAEPDTLLGSCSASCRGSQLTRHAEDTAVCVSSPTSPALDYCPVRILNLWQKATVVFLAYLWRVLSGI